jgi:hypothetical protein
LRDALGVLVDVLAVAGGRWLSTWQDPSSRSEDDDAVTIALPVVLAEQAGSGGVPGTHDDQFTAIEDKLDLLLSRTSSTRG